MIIKFKVFGKPTPKGRPRFAVRGRFATAYTDAKTREAEFNFRAQAIPYKPNTPLKSALRVDLTFSTIKPKSKPKRATFWSTKPDLDNLIKVLDSLNGVFWIDDSQIVELHAKKIYGDSAYTNVEITALEEEDGN